MAHKIRRRTLLDAALLGAVVPVRACGAGAGKLDLAALSGAASRIVPAERGASVKDMKLARSFEGGRCRAKLTNRGRKPVKVKEVVLFSLAPAVPAESTLYGESFQMLSQTVGTLGKPQDLGYPEVRHYKIPQPPDVTAVTGLLTLTPPGGDTVALAFTSCRRFIGRFYFK